MKRSRTREQGRGPWTWRAVVPGLLVLGLLAEACGIGAQGSPQMLPKSHVPYGLLAPTSTVPQSTVPVPAISVVVYFAEGQHLVATSRQVHVPATVVSALELLSKGPTSAETATGIQSPISTSTPLLLKSVDGGVASIALPSSFANLGGQDQILAAAQLVYTLTALPGVTSVVILVGGKPAQVPAADGTLAQGPLTRAEYSSLAPH
jgi:hypothetical protein